ncbi:MaoC family dehydratase [Cystobacter fuscus]|uniref:MaoC family dehydratase n=1 Tax=Cystobacter fuscus TaxID=43 RepID=UPI002B281A73|nr:acyl dehydratase [Cystobacter fuscus]
MSQTPRILEFDALPSLPRELLRAALSSRSARPADVPRLEARMRHLRAEPRALARYREVTGFPTDGLLPLTYPQVLVTPLHLAVLNHPEFPYRLLGMIHVRNRIQQWRRLREDVVLSVHVWVEGQREVRQGRELELHTRVEEGGTLAWSAVTTMLRRLPGAAERTRGARTPFTPDPEEEARFASSRTEHWTVREDTGRRYALASGDFNPIHLHALTARPFGFSRAIAHGMWTVGRGVAALGQVAQAPALTLTSDFRRPLLLPARAVFQAAPLAEGATAYRVRGEDLTPYVLGELRPGAESPTP